MASRPPRRGYELNVSIEFDRELTTVIPGLEGLQERMAPKYSELELGSGMAEGYGQPTEIYRAGGVKLLILGQRGSYTTDTPRSQGALEQGHSASMRPRLGRC